MRYGRNLKEKHKKLQRLLEKMKEGVVLAEGKRDMRAFRELGIDNVIATSGRIRSACGKLSGEEREVIIATDIDARGKEMADELKDELERYSIRADIRTRVLLAGLLKIKYFEDVKRGYDEFIEELEKTGDTYGKIENFDS